MSAPRPPKVFYSCAQLTSAALYSAWVVRTWALSNVDGNPFFFAALRGLYSGGSNFNQAPTAMWLSYSCQVGSAAGGLRPRRNKGSVRVAGAKAQPAVGRPGYVRFK